MNSAKQGKASGRDAPIEDPKLLRTLLETMLQEQTEFPIKVEGTSTLPYSSLVKSIDFSGGKMQLKLVRPLPHELMGGAVFRMTFAVGEQRYEALTEYIQREAYLTYSFHLPSALFFSDRRVHKRYPFRPREKAYVIAQDGTLPGLGVAGSLMNVGLGGVALRVDRVLKLDDGMRIPPSTAVFDRGRGFPRLRIQDLPRLPLLEVRGWAAHATDKGSEIILGLCFGEMDEIEKGQLNASLEFRDKILRSTYSIPTSGGTAVSVGPQVRSEAEEAAIVQDAHLALAGGPRSKSEAPDPLRLLRRRTAHLAVALAPGPRREEVITALRKYGFLRHEVMEPLKTTSEASSRASTTSYQLLLVDLESALQDVGEPLAAVRHLERQAQDAGANLTVILCETLDPTMLMAQESHTRFVAREEGGLETLGPLIDELLEI